MSELDRPDALDAEPIEPMGPIQMTTLAFQGNHFRGEILPELERLKREKIVRVLDLLLVRKDAQGDVMVTTGTDLEWDEAVSFGSYVGALAGFAAEGPAGLERGSIVGAAEMADGHLFDADDVFRVTQALPRNTSAALVLFEHLWAKPLMDAVARAGGLQLTNEWVRPEEVVSVADDAGRGLGRG